MQVSSDVHLTVSTGVQLEDVPGRSKHVHAVQVSVSASIQVILALQRGT